MKKTPTIFICISLFAMILTVFQYIPLLEEESGPDTELCKKAKETDDTSGDDDSCDNDSNENDRDQLNEFFNFTYFTGDASSYSFYLKNIIYLFPEKSIITPPPRS